MMHWNLEDLFYLMTFIFVIFLKSHRSFKSMSCSTRPQNAFKCTIELLIIIGPVWT